MLEFKLDEHDIKRINLWSYVVLKGTELMRIKGEEINKYPDKRRYLIEEVVRVSGSFNAKKINDLLDETKNALKNLGYGVREVEVKLVYKGLLGTGSSFGQLAFEVGLSFDPILGVPFIPGSSLKGAIRASYYALLQRDFKKEDSEKDIEKECDRLFGGRQVRASLINFTDAYPVQSGEKGYLLYPDVMTPHYKDAESELNMGQIKPITFLTIAPGTRFRFFIFWKDDKPAIKNYVSAKPEPRRESLGPFDLAVLLALGKGVGAKTTLGYSTFEVVRYE